MVLRPRERPLSEKTGDLPVLNQGDRTRKGAKLTRWLLTDGMRVPGRASPGEGVKEGATEIFPRKTRVISSSD